MDLRRARFQKGRRWKTVPVGQKSLMKEVEDITADTVTGSKGCPDPFAPATSRFAASSLGPVILSSGGDRSPQTELLVPRWYSHTLSSISGGKSGRSCFEWPGCPPCFRLPRRLLPLALFLSGLTISLDGGFDDVDEFLRALASSSCSLAFRTCNSAFRACNSAFQFSKSSIRDSSFSSRLVIRQRHLASDFLV